MRSQRPSVRRPKTSGTRLPRIDTAPDTTSTYGDRPASDFNYLWRGTAGPGDLDSLGAAVIARLDEELDLLALCQATEALSDDAGLHHSSTIRRYTYG